MTPKEEAEELRDKFYHLVADSGYPEELAVQCSIIAIEFAADQFEKYCCAEIGLHWTKDDEYTDGSWDHFRYIKEEAIKL
jgi:hypothetical protein